MELNYEKKCQHIKMNKSKLANYHIHVNPRLETVTCGENITHTEPVNFTLKFPS